MRYFFYGNASRRLKTGKFTFTFGDVMPFGGSWQGVLPVENADEIAALESEPLKRLGVKEISEEEYNEWTKKKDFRMPRSPDSLVRQSSSMKEAPAGRAVRIKDLNQTTPEVASAEKEGKPTFEEAVVIGTAPYIDPLEQRSNKKRVKKKAE